MDVCPKCHNQIIIGMNCCTGRPTLPTIEREPSPLLFLGCGVICPKCDGKGEVDKQTCKNCEGFGIVVVA